MVRLIKLIFDYQLYYHYPRGPQQLSAALTIANRKLEWIGWLLYSFDHFAQTVGMTTTGSTVVVHVCLSPLQLGFDCSSVQLYD